MHPVDATILYSQEHTANIQVIIKNEERYRRRGGNMKFRCCTGVSQGVRTRNREYATYIFILNVFQNNVLFWLQLQHL